MGTEIRADFRKSVIGENLRFSVHIEAVELLREAATAPASILVPKSVARREGRMCGSVLHKTAAI